MECQFLYNVQHSSGIYSCIFQPVNHYNEKPLPFIFGSKEWHRNTHVGLCFEQQDNYNSGDELSEAFSESSSSLAADNDSSNSEYASSAGNNVGAHFEVRNAASSIVNSKIRNINPLSESSSTHSSVAKIQTFNPLMHQLVSSESTSSSNSKTESPHNASVTSSHTQITAVRNVHSFTDLFTEPEPPEDISSTPSSSISRKPSNLFNDDEDEVFKHLVIAGKKRQNSVVTSSPVQPDIPMPNTETRKGLKPNTGLLEPQLLEELQDKLFKNSSDLPKPEESKNNMKKEIHETFTPKPPLNLFDDDDEDFLGNFVKNHKIGQTKGNTLNSSLPRENVDILFQDSDQNNKKISTNIGSNPHTNLFNDIYNVDESNNFKSKTNKREKVVEPDKHRESLSTILKSANLFDDDDDDDEYDLFRSKPTVYSEKENIKDQKMGETNIITLPRKRSNLFDDIENSTENIVEASGNAIEGKPTKNSMEASKVDCVTTYPLHGTTKDINDESYIEKLPEISDINPQNDNVVPLSRNINTLFDDDELFPKRMEITGNSNISPPTIYDKSKTQNLKVLELGSSENKEENNDGKPAKEEEYQSSPPKQITIANDQGLNVDSHLLSKEPEVLSVVNTIENIKDATINPNKIASILEEEDKKQNSNTYVNIAPSDVQRAIPGIHESIKEIDELSITNLVSESNVAFDKASPSSISKSFDFNSSLIFEEPPDDNDFFESLGKSSQNANTKFNSFDLENELYQEPDLPTKLSTTEKSLEYHLFSDIPPDDNDFEHTMPQKTDYTKCLGGVFFDDFNETLLAIDRCQDKTSCSHSVFNSEPPEIDKDEHETDDPLPTTNNDVKGGARQNTFVNRPISKLQMPNLNINVQALLPGNIGKPTTDKFSRKQSEEPEKDILVTQQTERVNENNGVVRTCETDHILPSINKNRIRAPANRRPSTRKARQESYRKSLIENELLYTEVDMSIETTKNCRPSQVAIGVEKSDKHTQPIESMVNHGSFEINTKAQFQSQESISDKNIIKPSSIFVSDNNEKDDIFQSTNAVQKPHHFENVIDTHQYINRSEPSSAENSKIGLLRSYNSSEEIKENPPLCTLIEGNEDKAITKTIFSDTDSENDDDFVSKLGSKKKEQPPLTVVHTFEKADVKKHTSIFSDDSDDDDFLQAPSVKHRRTPKSKPKVASPHSTSIFSDIDSDDSDLFKAHPKGKLRIFCLNNIQYKIYKLIPMRLFA